MLRIMEFPVSLSCNIVPYFILDSISKKFAGYSSCFLTLKSINVCNFSFYYFFVFLLLRGTAGFTVVRGCKTSQCYTFHSERFVCLNNSGVQSFNININLISFVVFSLCINSVLGRSMFNTWKYIK